MTCSPGAGLGLDLGLGLGEKERKGKDPRLGVNGSVNGCSLESTRGSEKRRTGEAKGMKRGE
jgi:hypothetical protein